MKTDSYRVHKLQDGEEIPFDLLLLADETRDAIEKYIYKSDVYLVFTKAILNPIAVFALYKINDLEIEIKNIAVLETFRSRGVGSFLIEKIKEIAGRDGYREIIVGTSDNGVRQIRFYERNGFTKYDVKRNFFLENYSEPIVENGLPLKDMIMLKAQAA